MSQGNLFLEEVAFLIHYRNYPFGQNTSTTNTNQIYNVHKITPKCESEARIVSYQYRWRSN